jgi:hypothetical protein
MSLPLIFNIETMLALLLSGIVARWYVMPSLRQLSHHAALTPLLLFSAGRYLGLNFMVPTMTAGLAPEFAVPAAYGDFAVGLIALVAAFLLRAGSPIGVILAWVYALLGTADFIHAGYLGNMHNMPMHIGASWPITFLLGPMWMVTIVLIFILLIKPNRAQ